MKRRKPQLIRYDIIGDELGRGRHSTVYRALDKVMGREVAIKVLETGGVSEKVRAELRQRFNREAVASARLNHSHIVAVYDYSEETNENGAYIVMELIEGSTLHEFLATGNRPKLAEIINLMGQILSALQAAHDKNIVHRDVKPLNILMPQFDLVKVADFGIAKFSDSNLTIIGAEMGTRTHWSPEQMKGLEVDHRTDIFSAGVVLYQLLTGELPFDGTPEEMKWKLEHESALKPSTFYDDLPTEVDSVVAKAMAKSPQDRFDSAVSFLDALRKAEFDLNATVRLPSSLELIQRVNELETKNHLLDHLLLKTQKDAIEVERRLEESADDVRAINELLHQNQQELERVEAQNEQLKKFLGDTESERAKAKSLAEEYVARAYSAEKEAARLRSALNEKAQEVKSLRNAKTSTERELNDQIKDLERRGIELQSKNLEFSKRIADLERLSRSRRGTSSLEELRRQHNDLASSYAKLLEQNARALLEADQLLADIEESYPIGIPANENERRHVNNLIRWNQIRIRNQRIEECTRLIGLRRAKHELSELEELILQSSSGLATAVPAHETRPNDLEADVVDLWLIHNSSCLPALSAEATIPLSAPSYIVAPEPRLKRRLAVSPPVPFELKSIVIPATTVAACIYIAFSIVDPVYPQLVASAHILASRPTTDPIQGISDSQPRRIVLQHVDDRYPYYIEHASFNSAAEAHMMADALSARGFRVDVLDVRRFDDGETKIRVVAGPFENSSEVTRAHLKLGALGISTRVIKVKASGAR